MGILNNVSENFRKGLRLKHCKYIRNEGPFSGFMENESERGTYKSPENHFVVQAICFSRALIHSPWTQKKDTHSLNDCIDKTSKLLYKHPTINAYIIRNCLSYLHSLWSWHQNSNSTHKVLIRTPCKKSSLTSIKEINHRSLANDRVFTILYWGRYPTVWVTLY